MFMFPEGFGGIGWGARTKPKWLGRELVKRLELASVEHSLRKVEKVEKHTGVVYGPFPQEDRIRLVPMAAPEPARDHMADSLIDFQPDHPVSLTPRPWQAHLTTIVHKVPAGLNTSQSTFNSRHSTLGDECSFREVCSGSFGLQKTTSVC